MKSKKSTAKLPLVRLVGWRADHDASATGATAGEDGLRLAPGIASAAAVAATGLLGPAALAAPGDLDPSFADVGRWAGPNLDGPLWSLDLQDDNAILFAGGEEYCGYYDYCDATDFTGRLLPDGTIDPGFGALSLDKATLYDTALQNDGKIVGVGNVSLSDGSRRLQVSRRLPNGSLDAGFGAGGLVVGTGATSVTETGRSVIVEPDGRIVVAGHRDGKLFVARFLASGALDPAFGTGGVIFDAAAVPSDQARVLRAPGGGYRVMTSRPGATCTVSGLTEAGTLDAGFGNAGIAAVTTVSNAQLRCNSVAIDANGRLLLGGSSLGASFGGNGNVARLLANGTLDPGFSDAAISARFREVTALTIGPTGAAFVAGLERTGFAGATVVRMLPDGTLDPTYGRAGWSRIELNGPRSSGPVIHDMRALGNDALVVGGGIRRNSYRTGHFVARLLGNAAGGGPGVLSMQQDPVLGTEQSGQATVTVRRIGGTSGAVAVSYSARDLAASYLVGRTPASKGMDYTAIAGRLNWADGDDSERQIVVPIASDTLAETPEFFELALDTPEGGAGLGVSGAEIEIAGEGYPAGLLSLRPALDEVSENDYATFYVAREPYSVGTVTVTVRVAGGSATPGRDFANLRSGAAWSDVTVTLPDGQRGANVTVWIAGDRKKEQRETLTLEIVSPTGGAALMGALTKATVTIVDTNGHSSRRGSAGGGAFGWFAALLLGLGGGLRRMLASDRRRQPGA